LEGFEVFLLGELLSFEHDLAEIGKGISGLGFNKTASGGGEKGVKGSAEVAGGRGLRRPGFRKGAAATVGKAKCSETKSPEKNRTWEFSKN
jgi:hypothetical protein